VLTKITLLKLYPTLDINSAIILRSHVNLFSLSCFEGKKSFTLNICDNCFYAMTNLIPIDLHFLERLAFRCIKQLIFRENILIKTQLSRSLKASFVK